MGALDYLGNAQVRYRYRIDGLDHDWIDNGNRAEITYTLLPAGHYLLRVQSTNHDGVWNPRELQLPINVTPPLWRHPLALVAVARRRWPRLLPNRRAGSGRAAWRCT